MHGNGAAEEERLEAITRSSPIIQSILSRADEIALPHWRLCAGCIAQTVWNHITGRPPDHGIGDIDIIYYDAADLSAKSETAAEDRLRLLFGEVGPKLDVKNQARVHLWYETVFGKKIEAFGSVEAAIACFPTTATAVGLALSGAEMSTDAPYGLTDLLGLVVRPNRRLVDQAVYEAKVRKWRRHWPDLTYLSWDSA